MGRKDQLQDSLQEDGRESRRGVRHSKAYHRFFEGYSEIAVPKPDGKGYRTQRVYTGDIYRQDLTDGRRILLRLLYVALFLGTAYSYVSSAILPVASNSTWYVTLPQAVSLAFLFWIVIAFVSYLPAKRDMTINEYRTSSRALQRATLGSAVSLGTAAVATLVFVLLNPSNEPLAELLCAAKYIVGGVLALSMNRVEKGVNYLIIPSQNTPPADGNGEYERHP